MRVSLGVAVGTALAAVGAAIPFLLRRKDPKEKERRRRESVFLRGRAIEGCAIDWMENVVVYTYEWRGVRYEAAQDLSDFLPAGANAEPLSGPVTVKFLPNAPANSIVISETWSGLPGLPRTSKRR